MDASFSIVSLGVADMQRSRQFYEQGLGWRTSAINDGEVAFYQAGAGIIGLYNRAKLTAEGNLPPVNDPQNVHSGVTLAQNQANKADIDDLVAGAVRAGGTLRREPADTFWGGYAGSFADPDSHIEEIAWNPFFTLDKSGIRLPD